MVGLLYSSATQSDVLRRRDRARESSSSPALASLLRVTTLLKAHVRELKTRLHRRKNAPVAGDARPSRPGFPTAAIRGGQGVLNWLPQRE